MPKPPKATGAGVRHLRKADARLAKVIDAIGALEAHASVETMDHFTALVRIIVGQQLSVLAARAIYNRLLGYFDGKAPTARQLLKADIEALRAAAGLSRPKVGYLHSLAELVASGTLDLSDVDHLSDEDVMTRITVIRGMGEWSAHMYLMFHLDRPDVLATGDLGIRKAVQRLYRLKELPLAPEIERIAQPWRPYRTLACRYLWRSLDSNLPLD